MDGKIEGARQKRIINEKPWLVLWLNGGSLLRAALL